MSEEVDFVEWASKLNNKHPIAKQYQNLRKDHFRKIRKDIMMKEMYEKRERERAESSGGGVASLALDAKQESVNSSMRIENSPGKSEA